MPDLVRESLRRELQQQMDQQLREQTEIEMKHEVATCEMIAKMHKAATVISDRSLEFIKKRDTPGDANIDQMWQALTDDEKKLFGALVVAEPLPLQPESTLGHLAILTLKEMNAFKNQRTRFARLNNKLFRFESLLSAAERVVKVTGEDLEHIRERLTQYDNVLGRRHGATIVTAARAGGASAETISRTRPNQLVDSLRQWFEASIAVVQTGMEGFANWFRKALTAVPDPARMACREALTLAIKMHRERRLVAANLEEATAEDHFFGGCHKTPGCEILSNLYSPAGKHMHDDEEFAKAERELAKMPVEQEETKEKPWHLFTELL